MRAVLTILAAIGLAALAVMFFLQHHWMTGGAFLAGSLALVLPALFGQGLGNLGDAQLLIDFVRDPVDTVVDEAIDRILPDDEQTPRPTKGKGGEPFDPDAAFARYMAQREIPAAEPLPPPLPAVRTFGRKQVGQG